VLFPPDSDVTARQCAIARGAFMAITGWMVHAWVVPGCESDWGMFSGANPRLPYLPGGATLTSGCNSGRSTTDRLQLDDRGSGPRIKEEAIAT